MESKTDKRIVSKGAYVMAQGKRVCLGLISGCLLLATIYFALIFLIGVIGTIATVSFVGILAVALVGVIVYFLGRWTRATFNTVRNLDPGIPLTRANTAGLPAPDSLVRASSEPLQTQETVLLRAAAEGAETPPEQLVRASMGQE